eukprot:763690-Hanusia_phi.AAC.3
MMQKYPEAQSDALEHTVGVAGQPEQGARLAVRVHGDPALPDRARHADRCPGQIVVGPGGALHADAGDVARYRDGRAGDGVEDAGPVGGARTALDGVPRRAGGACQADASAEAAALGHVLSAGARGALLACTRAVRPVGIPGAGGAIPARARVRGEAPDVQLVRAAVRARPALARRGPAAPGLVLPLGARVARVAGPWDQPPAPAGVVTAAAPVAVGAGAIAEPPAPLVVPAARAALAGPAGSRAHALAPLP